MTTARRLSMVVGGLGILAVTTLPWLQAKDVIMEDPSSTPFTSAVHLQKDRRAQQVMNAAEQLIKEEEWGQVVRALQQLLDTPDDAFVQVSRPGVDGKPTEVDVSIRSEASRMLGSMPPEGLQFYEVAYGPIATALLAEAKTRNDPQLFAEVARRFLHTDAGAEAVTHLGTRFLDRNEPLHAALYFEKLMSRPGWDQLPTWTHLKAALAFHRAGDEARREEVLRLITQRTLRDGGVRIGTQVVGLHVLRQEMDQIFKPDPQAVNDCPIFRGAASRTAQGDGSPPFLERSWRRDLYSPEADARRWTDQLLKDSIRYLADQRDQPILPALFPVATGGKVIYRSYDGVYAVKLGDVRQDPNRIAWLHPTEGGLSRSGVFADDKRGYLEQWRAHYLQYGPQGILFENSVLGTLSTDGQRVFFIDDMIMPPHPMVLRNAMFGNMPNFGALRDQVTRNSLKCINLETGKFVWELSGRFNTQPTGMDAKDLREKGFDDSFFLGPPLPLGGKLYVLNERNSELRLVCLECKDEINVPRPPEVLWIQTLANVRDKLQFDLSRRIHAAHLAYGDGILVCPTNAGVVLAVDLLSHSLVWAYSYREASDEEKRPQGPAINRFRQPQVPVTNTANEWKIAAPAIADGKVVFTAPDASSMHCVNLRDGRRLWTVSRGSDDLFFAGVYAGKALVVGKKSCKLISVATGKQVGPTIANTGTPTGQGTASGNVYYLPTKVGPDHEPEVCAIDLERGEIVAHTKSRNGAEQPGNLIFHDGEVISQAWDHVTSYPQLYARMRVIDEGLKQNPHDAAKLILRGELHLDRGNLAAAYEDLHNALKYNPPADQVPKARQKLYDTLTELLSRNFNQYEPRLAEYSELCQAAKPEEQLRRRGNYLCLLGKGREGQGRLVEAFEAYMEFGALAGNQELVSVADEPNAKSRPDVWARGRITAMLAKATPEERRPLEDLIRTRYDGIKDSSDLEALRGFVRVFGSTFGAGRQARLRLAEQLIAAAKDEQADELREAQLHLLQLRALKSSEPQLAGQAVEALIRLMEKKARGPGQQGLMEHAAHYYRELGRDFASVPIRDGKTGADFYNEFTTDKRFLPYLEEPRTSWHGKLKGEPRTGQFQMRPTITLEPVGEALPFFRHNRLALDTQIGQLRVINQNENEDTWQLSSLVGLQYLTQGGHTNFRSVFHVQGHLVVAQLGHMVYAFDPVDKKKLWEYNLYEPGKDASTAPKLAQVLRDRDGNIQLLYQDNWMQKLGGTGPVQPSYVCLQTRDQGLVALDPLTGTVLWTKSDVSSRTSFFGDAEHVYLVETNENGQASSAARAVRATDGVSISVPDFAQLYDQRIAILGRTLLVQDEAAGGIRLRRYDVPTGKDLWSSVFPAGSIILKSDEERLAGAVAPDGTLTVFDVLAQRKVLKTNLFTEHKERTRPTIAKEALQKVQEAHLVADRDLYYLVLNQPVDANLNSWMSVYPGLRCIPANGTVAAYDRGSGQRRWVDDLDNQMMVLEQFDTLPVVFFTARHNKWFQNGNNRFAQPVVDAKVIHKSSGKLVFSHEFPQNTNQFHAIKADPREGTIELVSFNTMIRLYPLEQEGRQSAQAEPPAAPAGLDRRIEPVVIVPQPVGAQPGQVRARIVLPARAVPVQIEVAPVQRR